MRGDGPSRFCDACGEHVHALATEDEARALFRRARSEGAASVCVRYLRAAGVMTTLAASACSADEVAPAQVASIHPPTAIDIPDAGPDTYYWMGRRAVGDCEPK